MSSARARRMLWLGLLLIAGCAGVLDPNLPPRNGYIRPQNAAGDPIIERGIVTGSYSLKDSRRASTGCVGYVTKEPSFVLELLSEQQFMRVFVESQLDTTLMIRMPSGQYVCDDNSFGWNPKIEGPFRSGIYAIWVGGSRPDLNTSYNLVLTTQQGLTSTTQGPPNALPPR